MKRLLFIQNTLAKFGVLPSWVILIIDVFLLCLSSFISYIFFKDLGVGFYQEFPFKLRFSITLSIYTFYFLLFKTYIGIIRYSTLNDIVRLSKAVFAALATLFLFDSIYFFSQKTHIFVAYTLFYSNFFIFFTCFSHYLIYQV